MFCFFQPFLREGPSCSTSLSELDSRRGIKENGGSNGDFLTLAPPSTSSYPNTRSKQPIPGHPAFYSKDYSKFESLPYQVKLKHKPAFLFPTPLPTHNLIVSTSCFKGNIGDLIRLHPTEPVQHHHHHQQQQQKQQQQQQPPFYSFLPPANAQNGPAVSSSSNCNGGEVGGSVDLNLKL